LPHEDVQLIKNENSNCFFAAVANVLSPKVNFWKKYFSPESKYFKKDKYDLATVNEEMRNVSNGKFLFKFEKKNWGIFNWSNIKKYANGQYLIVVGWDEISYYEEVGKNKIRILHAISIDFASSFEPIFYDSSEPNIAYLFDSNTMFKILPVICELYTINQHFFQDEPSSYNVID
jgi:hypothetical protein